LVTSIPELEVWCGRGELVDELVDCVCEPRVFITLEIGFEIVFRETFIDLR